MSKVQEIDGLPVIDARKAVKITITADDVKRASRKKPNTCAIARTCLREPGVKEVRIHLTRAYMRTNTKNWVKFLVPRVLRSEIIAFDRGGRFAPGEYKLYKVNPAQRIGRKMSADTPKTGRKRKRAKMHFISDVRSGPA